MEVGQFLIRGQVINSAMGPMIIIQFNYDIHIFLGPLFLITGDRNNGK